MNVAQWDLIEGIFEIVLIVGFAITGYIIGGWIKNWIKYKKKKREEN